MTVGSAGDLTISDGASPPAPATVDAHQAVAVQQVHFAAATEAVRVDSYTLTTTGSGDDATGVAQVALYLDTNGNGALDADTLVAAGTLAVDDGSLVFSASGAVHGPGRGRPRPAGRPPPLERAQQRRHVRHRGPLRSGRDRHRRRLGRSITPTGGAGAGAVMSFGTAVDASASTVALAPASAVADGADATTVTVTLVDAIGAPLAGLGSASPPAEAATCGAPPPAPPTPPAS